MGKLNDPQIRAWIQAGERFEGKADGGGLYLRFRPADKVPSWRFRYSIGGAPRVLHLGSYGELSLADARRSAKDLKAKVTLGHDVAGEKAERVKVARERIEAGRNAATVSKLADEYFERMILGKWKHPNIVRARIEKDIRPEIGALALADVKPRHIDALLQKIVRRGAPTMANDVLRWLRRMFDYAIRRHMMESNPAAAFVLEDAGGKEAARDRALTRDELKAFLAAMREAKGFSVENALAVKLLLLLAVRKMELLAAKWEEFDLDGALWNLPGERTKTGEPIAIPLPAAAVEWLGELKRLAGGSEWVFPARKLQTRQVPHVCESTIGVALAKVKHGLEPFTVHDFRRTARTHLAALGVPDHVAERVLNHKLKGVTGVYNRHDYLAERRAALEGWAALLCELDQGAGGKVVPIMERKHA
ncbi:MAG: tyrosine-type recombinase/integrase [Rhodocyclaceae bacterium]|nr:tyrosine-type recombinase/integrase [Rhodocyclaceae bacterium]